jgi:hypothetical protein
MNNRKVKIFFLVLVLLVISTGALLLILPYVVASVKGTSFAGIMLLLAGGIIFFEKRRLECLLKQALDRIINYFKNEDKIYFYFFLAILISGIAFRILYLTKPINYNEASIYLDYINEKTFHRLFFYYSADNYILNNIMIKFLYLISNRELWVLRLPSLLAGVALIPAVYATTRLFYDKSAGLIAAAIISASPFFIYYSVDLRGISLLMLLFFILLMLIKYLKANNDTIVWIFFSAVSALGFFVSPMFLLAFTTVILWIILSVLFKDTVYRISEIAKRCITAITCTFIFTFLFYIPVILAAGIKNTKNLNFIRTASFFQSFYSSFLSIRNTWIEGNKNLNIFFLILLGITVLISLTIHRKLKVHKVCIFYSMAAVILIFLFSGIKFSGEQAFAFTLPLIIMVASAAIRFIVESIRLKIVPKEKRGNIKWVLPSVSLLLLAAIFISGFFTNSVENINNENTLKDYGKMANDSVNMFTAKNKILYQKPSDLILQYYLSKKGMDLESASQSYFPPDSIIIVVNKSLGQSLEEMISNYYNIEYLYNVGFSEPQILFDYDTATVYGSKNLAIDSNIIFNLDTSSKSLDTLNGFELTNVSGVLELSTNENYSKSLKSFQVPIKIEKGTDYLITFEIKQNIKMNNSVSFDFTGKDYDNPQQEFNLKPGSFEGDSFVPVRRVINSGSLNDNIEVFFRVFSYSSGQFTVRNLKIYKIAA